MTENLFCFKADHRDGRVYVGGKVYAASTESILSERYCVRIAVFSDDVNYSVIRQLENGYLNISEFVSTGRNVPEAMKSLPKLHPFDMPDNSAVTDCVTNLFTDDCGKHICKYLSEKAKVSMFPQNALTTTTIGAKFITHPAMTITMSPAACTLTRRAVSSSPPQATGSFGKLQKSISRKRLSYRSQKSYLLIFASERFCFQQDTARIAAERIHRTPTQQ